MHALHQDNVLSHLYQHRVFHSRRKLDSHLPVAQELVEHVLVWKSGAVDTSMHRVRVDKCHVLSLKYGAEVVVRPRPFDNFSLIHLSVSGAAEIETSARRVVIREGMAAHIAPWQNVRLRWQEGSEQLILKLPHTVWEDACRLTGAAAGLNRMPAIASLSAPGSAHLGRLIHALIGASGMLSQGLHGCDRSWISHSEINVALFIASQLLKDGRDAARSPVRGAVPDNPKRNRIDALAAYMRSALDAPLTLARLAHAAGMSMRSLHQLCNEQRGESPMDMLRGLRLERARQLLRDNPFTNVADVALAVGFNHPGRFSGYYRKRFNESPRETQKHAGG